MLIHPAIRVCLLVVLAAVLPALGLIEVYAFGLLLLAALGVIGAAAMGRAGSFVWRSRWLLASIALVYLAFTPGQPVLAALPGISLEGILEALRRAGVLLVLLCAVVCLQATTPTTELSAAIVQLLRPLSWLGLNPDSFALRLGLAMEYATQQNRRQSSGASAGWLDRAALRIEQVEASSPAADATASLSIPALETPPPWQWLLPLGLLCGALAWAH